MSSQAQHSCHWDWCRFTTPSHDDFVQHVIKVHIDKAETVKREDISLIRHVEQGASSHSGPLPSGQPATDPFFLLPIELPCRWHLKLCGREHPIRSSPIRFTT